MNRDDAVHGTYGFMIIAELTATADKTKIENKLADALTYMDGVGKIKVIQLDGLTENLNK